MNDLFSDYFQLGNKWSRLAWALVLPSMLLVLYGRFSEGFSISHLQLQYSPEHLPFQIGKIFAGPSEISKLAYGYVLLGSWVPAFLSISVWPSIWQLVVFLLCWSLFLASSSYLSGLRFWVLLGLATILGPLMVPEDLASQSWLVLAIRLGSIAANAISLYAINYFLRHWAFGRRFMLVLGGNTLWLALALSLGDPIAQMNLIIAYGQLPLLVLSILFIVQTSYVLPYIGMQVIVRQNVNGIFGYFLFFLFYGGNVLVAYLHSRNMWEGTIFYFDPIVLLIIATLLGLYMFRDFALAGALWFSPDSVEDPEERSLAIYPAWAGLCFSTMTLALARDNSPLIDVFEDAVYFSYMGSIVGFLLYIVINFLEALMARKRIDRIFFEPKHFPLSMVYITMATGIFLAFSAANRFPFFQGVAGYYNHIADAYLQQGNLQTAELFYLKAIENDNYNFRSNYAVAAIAQTRKDPQRQRDYLKTANEIKPRPSGFIALAHQQNETGHFLDALLTLQDGIKAFPNSVAIANNRLVLLGQSTLTDSLQKAAASLKTENDATAMANIAGLVALGKLPLEAMTTGKLDNEPAENNLSLAQAAQMKSFCQPTKASGGKSLTTLDHFIVQFGQYATCPSKYADTTLPSALGQMADNDARLEEDANYAAFLNFAANRNQLQAWQTIERLARRSLYQKAYYIREACVYAIEHDFERKALDLLESTRDKMMLPDSGLIATMQAEQMGYKSFSLAEENKSIELSKRIVALSAINAESATKLPIADRYLWLCTYATDLESESVAALLRTFKGTPLLWPGLKVAAEGYSKSGKPEAAVLLWQLVGLEMPKSKSLESEYVAGVCLAHILSAGQGKASLIAQLEPMASPAWKQLLVIEKGKTLTYPTARVLLEQNTFDTGFLSILLSIAQKRLTAPEAFELAREAYQINKQSGPSAEAYIALCTKLGYDSFAQSAREALSE